MIKELAKFKKVAKWIEQSIINNDYAFDWVESKIENVKVDFSDGNLYHDNKFCRKECVTANVMFLNGSKITLVVPDWALQPNVEFSDLIDWIYAESNYVKLYINDKRHRNDLAVLISRICYLSEEDQALIESATKSKEAQRSIVSDLQRNSGVKRIMNANIISK